MPTVLVPGVLRPEAGGLAHLQVAADGTLRAVLDEIAARWPRLERRLRDESGALRRYVNVYVDGEDCRRSGGLDTPVPAGAEIQVLPSVAGGANGPNSSIRSALAIPGHPKVRGVTTRP
jgi:molybdopterin synthase sulfur carrier subunit